MQDIVKLPELPKPKNLPRLNKLGLPRIPTTGTLFDEQKKKRFLTSEDLYKLSEDVGLKDKADYVLSNKGEEFKEIFSGGIISDIFDLINITQYGIVGMIKGKTFAEGVKKRASFTDKDMLGDEGLPGVIMGILLDITVDPTTYIAPWTILKKVPGIAKISKGLVSATSKTKIGQWFGRKFIYSFGKDPVYLNELHSTARKIVGSQRKILESAEILSKVDDDVAKNLMRRLPTGEYARIPFDEIGLHLSGKEKASAEELWRTMDKYGELAKKYGLIKTKKEDYIANLYKEFEFTDKAVAKSVLGKKLRIQGERFRHRKLVAPTIDEIEALQLKGDIVKANQLLKKREKIFELRKKLGEIEHPAYPLAKALVQVIKDVENAKLFKFAADNYSFADDISKLGKIGKEAQYGLTKMSNSSKLGALKGKYVPTPIADTINEMIRVKTPGEKIGNKLMMGFKYGHVILNPATHARNIFSNFILNSWEGLSPLRMDIYANAASELVKKGKWYRAAKLTGLGENTYTNQELRSLLLSPDAVSKLGKSKNIAKKAINKIADLYQGEENYAKLAQFIYQAKKLGAKTPKEALTKKIFNKTLGKSETIAEYAFRIAEKATFNYAQITPFIRHLRESVFGLPFITFTAKATGQAIKTVAEKPSGFISLHPKIIGKIKNAIENLTDLKELKEERKNEPQWVRDGFYIKLPMKDKYGRSAYFDLTYIIPFGDLISGQFLERQIDRETGLRESFAESAIRKSPLINLITEIGKNQDFYGNKIWRSSDSTEKQLADLMRHIAKAYLPPLVADNITGGHYTAGRKAGTRRPTAINRVKETGAGSQYRTLAQELIRNLGLKVQPVNIDIQKQYMEMEKKKALETMLKEEGVLRDFSRVYKTKK